MKQRSVIIPSRKNIEPLKFRSSLGGPLAEDDIRRRAYEIYEKRGCMGGHAIDDWLEAEREVRNSHTGAA